MRTAGCSMRKAHRYRGSMRAATTWRRFSWGLIPVQAQRWDLRLRSPTGSPCTRRAGQAFLLLDLDVGFLRHPGPFHDLAADERAKFGWRGGNRIEPCGGE